MKKINSRLLILVTLFIILCLYLLNSSLITNNILIYTKLFLTKLFPSSFIFFIISSLLLDYNIINTINKIFHINGSKSYIILMSLISGFPSGPKYIKDLYNKNIINQTTSNNYLMFTHFPNPLFILSTVSLIIQDNYLTISLLISIILSNLLISIKYKSNENKVLDNNPIFINSLVQSINKSIKIIIQIYGISLFFYLISVIINKYIFINPNTYILINGIFDLTSGIISVKLLKDKIKRTLLILIFISFGSLSIHMQIKSILMDTNLSYKSFLKGRIISTILSILIFLIFLLIKV